MAVKLKVWQTVLGLTRKLSRLTWKLSSNIQLDLLEDEDDHEDNEVGTIFSEERRFIRSDVFEFPPPPSYVHSKKIDSDDSIFGEDSEHVDSEHVTSPDGKNPPGGKNLNQDLTRTNSITFNIKKGNIKRSQIKLLWNNFFHWFEILWNFGSQLSVKYMFLYIGHYNNFTYIGSI